MIDLENTVALVTGASRGIGRGIAFGLLEAGATVHVTGRRFGDPAERDAFSTEVSPFPGRVVFHEVDHAIDAETEAVVAKVITAEGRLDILVNNAWPGYERMVEGDKFTWVDPLWEQPMWRWDAMMGVGVRSAYCASRPAARQMAEQKRGLIVNISFWAAEKFMQNAVYGMAKAAMNKLAADLAVQLREFGIAAIALYPGLVRTEGVMENAHHFDMSNSESPQFQGRAVANLFADPALMEKSSKVFTTAGLALEYGFTDIDGYRPRPNTLETV